MIRDPSDGTVKEIELDQREATGSRASEKFTPASKLFDEIKSNVIAGKVKPEALSPEWVYQRAWNDALDFALREIGKIEIRVTASHSSITEEENGSPNHCIR